MILSKVADPTYRSCYPQDAEWSQVHQGRVLVALGVWASAQPADMRRFPHAMPWRKRGDRWSAQYLRRSRGAESSAKYLKPPATKHYAGRKPDTPCCTTVACVLLMPACVCRYSKCRRWTR